MSRGYLTYLQHSLIWFTLSGSWFAFVQANTHVHFKMETFVYRVQKNKVDSSGIY
jgi:hypothetical protein